MDEAVNCGGQSQPGAWPGSKFQQVTVHIPLVDLKLLNKVDAQLYFQIRLSFAPIFRIV